MKNILKLTTIATLLFVTNSGQATQLVKVETINPIELIEMSKVHLEQAMKLNTIAMSPIAKTAREQVAMNHLRERKSAENTVKTFTLAE